MPLFSCFTYFSIQLMYLFSTVVIFLILFSLCIVSCQRCFVPSFSLLPLVVLLYLFMYDYYLLFFFLYSFLFFGADRIYGSQQKYIIKKIDGWIERTKTSTILINKILIQNFAFNFRIEDTISTDFILLRLNGVIPITSLYQYKKSSLTQLV